MGTKTIGLDDEAYELLRAEKREDESFSDTVKRITEVVNSDWQSSFGKYSDLDGEQLESVARDSRARAGAGLTRRQRDAVEILSGAEATGDDE
jgi:predicted CopG family antitoxin